MDSRTHATYMNRIIRLPECSRITGRSASSIQRGEKQGLFPCRVRLGDNAIGWHMDEILDWVNSREEVTVENCKKIVTVAKRGRKPRNTPKEG